MDNFPWFLIVFAIVGLVLGIWLLMKYRLYYKHKPWIIIASFILAIIIAGIIVDMTGINDVLYKKGPMQGVMHQYFGGCEKPDISNCNRN